MFKRNSLNHITGNYLCRIGKTNDLSGNVTGGLGRGLWSQKIQPPFIWLNAGSGSGETSPTRGFRPVVDDCGSPGATTQLHLVATYLPAEIVKPIGKIPR